MWLYFAAERSSYYYPDSILISINPAGAVWDKMEIQKTLSIYIERIYIFTHKSNLIYILNVMF